MQTSQWMFKPIELMERCRRRYGPIFSMRLGPAHGVTVVAEPRLAKQVLAGSSVSYDNVAGPAGMPATIMIGTTVIPSYTSKGLPAAEAKAKDAAFKKSVADALKAAGYPANDGLAPFHAPHTV
jgi:cytochrome P450